MRTRRRKDYITDEQKMLCLDLLVQQLDTMHVAYEQKHIDALLRYVYLFFEWNHAYNLTSVRNVVSLVSRHVIDSLSLLPHLKDGQRVLDVGSGAGLPGIPLAIMNPSLKVGLLECNGKKTCFLRQVVSELSLKNCGVLQKRIESYQPQNKFDVIVSRAFASLSTLVESTQACIHEESRLIAMKGLYPQEELEAIAMPYEVLPLTPTDDQVDHRHLVFIELGQSLAYED